MISPGRYDIGADRWVACIRTFAFVGLDFTDAVFAAQVRQTPDAPGDPLVDLETVVSASAEGVRLIYGGTDTIANHIAAARLAAVPGGINPATGLAYAAGDMIAVSQVGLRINETTMEGLPFPAAHGGERGDDAIFHWDMHITPSGGIKDKYLGGMLTVRAGVTQ